MCVRHRDVLPDGGFEGSDTGMHPPTQLAFGEECEPAFHQIESRGAGRGEVEMEPWAFQQPPADQGRLMRAIVVEDQMHVQTGRDAGFDGVQELPEFSGTMSLMQLPNDAARLHFQRSEERGRAMAAVVMRATLDLPRAHRQQRARAIQRLNLRFLIDAQDKRFVRGMEIQTDDIPNLLDEQRIGRQLERLGPMRLQAKGPPDAVHGAAAYPPRLCHGTRAPVRRVRRRRLQGLGDDLFNGRIRHRAWRTGARFIQQLIETRSEKTLSPFADGLLATRTSRATVVLDCPSAQARIMHARFACPPHPDRLPAEPTGTIVGFSSTRKWN